MPAVDLRAFVSHDIADLIPPFLENRRRDIDALREAVRSRSSRRLEFLASRMYAAGNPYGFRQITTFGRLIREACASGRLEGVDKVIDEYERYLEVVEVEFVAAPPKRAQWKPRSAERRTQTTEPPSERRREERRKDLPAGVPEANAIGALPIDAAPAAGPIVRDAQKHLNR